MPLIDLEKLFDAEHDKVRHLDHRMLSGVDRVGEFHHVLHSLGLHDLKAAEPGNGGDIDFELFLLVNDYDAAGRPTQPRLHVLIHDRRHVIERQKIRDATIEGVMLCSISRAVQRGLRKSDVVHMMRTLTDELEQIQGQLIAPLSIMAFKEAFTVRTEKFTRVQFEPGWNWIRSEILGDDTFELAGCSNPTLVPHGNTAQNEDRLLAWRNVSSRAARFIQIKEMHTDIRFF